MTQDSWVMSEVFGMHKNVLNYFLAQVGFKEDPLFGI